MKSSWGCRGSRNASPDERSIGDTIEWCERARCLGHTIGRGYPTGARSGPLWQARCTTTHSLRVTNPTHSPDQRTHLDPLVKGPALHRTRHEVQLRPQPSIPFWSRAGVPQLRICHAANSISKKGDDYGVAFTLGGGAVTSGAGLASRRYRVRYSITLYNASA